jgi:hypothetical protein
MGVSRLCIVPNVPITNQKNQKRLYELMRYIPMVHCFRIGLLHGYLLTANECPAVVHRFVVVIAKQ